MKIRNKDRSIDISDIYIKKNDVCTDILIIVNNKVYKFFVNSTYIDIVLDKINNYVKEINYE